MKTGKSIVELATEISRRADAKKDFIGDTRQMTVYKNGEAKLKLEGVGEFPIGDVARSQICEHTGIPSRYFDRMLAEQPQLWESNVNTWLNANPAKRLVRTLDGSARAFLSERYRPLDNEQLAEAILPVLVDLDLEIMSAEITDRRLYVKAVDRRILVDMPTGKKWGDGSHTFFDTHSPAIIISNSEVGCGSLSIEAGIFTKLCTNLAIASTRSMRKYHIGRAGGNEENIRELLTDETKRLSDAAVFSQARDVVKAAFDRAKFESLVGEFQETTTQMIEGDPVKAIELVAKEFTLNDGERGSVLKHLISGGDLSRYGLLNAITRTAEDLPDYDRATDFERMGGKVIELPRRDWDRIAKAA